MILSVLLSGLLALSPGTTEPPEPAPDLDPAVAGFALFTIQDGSELMSLACAVDSTDVAVCYGLRDGVPVAFTAPLGEQGWTDFVPLALDEPVTTSEPDLPYVDPDVLSILVEEWREDNRPDIDAPVLLDIATNYCTAEGEDPMIIAMLIDNGDIGGTMLDFLTDICPDLIAIYDAAL